ncbi:MAG: HAD family hydrolase [Burkholderiales bacterium]|nr:HAD family hydrolase [Burkholderiales bacterium]
MSGVLLDIDGTLLNSNDAHAEAWLEIFRRYGYVASYDSVRPLIGKGGDKLLPEITGLDEESEVGEQMAEERKTLFMRDYLPRLRPTAGARRLVERLRKEGFRLVVATSAGDEELGLLLQQAEVKDLIEQATTANDAEHSKPDPDIVQAALAMAKLRPEEAVMIGDTPHDIEAARRAGLPTIALRCGGWWDDAALAGAVAIYDDPAALVSELDRSPLAIRQSINPGAKRGD